MSRTKGLLPVKTLVVFLEQVPDSIDRHFRHCYVPARWSATGPEAREHQIYQRDLLPGRNGLPVDSLLFRDR